MDREEASQATRQGAIAALISGGLTLVFVWLAIALDAQGTFSIFNDVYYLFDVALIFILAFGVYKKSRYAAIVLTVYFVVSKLMLAIERGGISTGTLLLSFIFLYFYVKALQGCFAFKKLEKQENSNYKKLSKWFFFAGLPITAVVIVLAAVLLIDYIIITPSTQVQTARQVASRDAETLVANDILAQDERLDYFYSFGTDPMAQGGVLLTKERVLMYLPDDVREGYYLYGIPFAEVSEIELIRAGDEQTESVYRVSSTDGFWIQFGLATKGNGDESFIESLKTRASNTNGN